ncbi:hypothetical protein GQ53DRAFT_815058 [Thozetella sp. PMI_491]|nr:hypothetical protein GQ53DRAFT_815058 [Thozetella sp. PMI_491]
MSGDVLNVINTLFKCAYFTGQIPNNLAMKFVHDWMHICVLRFSQAPFEGSTFIGTRKLLGSWYKDGGLGKRTGIFTASGLTGTLFPGLLQGGVYASPSLLR